MFSINVYSKKQKAVMTPTCKTSTINQALRHFLPILLKIPLQGTIVANYIRTIPLRIQDAETN